MSSSKSTFVEPRRGSRPVEEDYLRLVGERVRMQRARRGMSRRVLSNASGVSERYLAELERGSGNASLLVLRQIAAALSIRVGELVSDQQERPLEQARVLSQIERLDAAALRQVRDWITERFGHGYAPAGRIALTGLRGAGKTTLGRRLAERLGIAFVDVAREVESAAGMELSQVFAQLGQAGYRELEYDRLETIVRRYERAVIATGGSLVTEPRTYDLLLSSCFVVWLQATPEDHMARVARQGDLRPMDQSRQAMDDLRAILASRTALYGQAHAELDTSAADEDRTFDALLALIGPRR